MKRRALIIYCNDTASGALPGPEKDFEKISVFLDSKTGGEWRISEIRGLQNPSISTVQSTISEFMADVDYTFILFTGHGFINEQGRQLMEVSDGDISIKDLHTKAPRQTIIIDACRQRVVSTSIAPEDRLFSKVMESTLHLGSTRRLFDNSVLRAAEGLSILYAASKNEASADSDNGAPYLISLLKIAEDWRDEVNRDMVLSIKDAHDKAAAYLAYNFDEVTQIPKMKFEKRNTYYPFAVKVVQLKS
jgi:hypothetical protein